MLSYCPAEIRSVEFNPHSISRAVVQPVAKSGSLIGSSGVGFMAVDVAVCSGRISGCGIIDAVA
jgi:hypothetical protein